MTDAEVRERVERLEELLLAAEDSPAAIDAVAALAEVYGEALRRMVQGADPQRDELVSHLLLLHEIEAPTLLQITPRARSA